MRTARRTAATAMAAALALAGTAAQAQTPARPTEQAQTQVQAQTRARAVGADRPTAEAWSVTRNWDAQAEREFGGFVQAIGRGVSSHHCRSLSQCLNDPAINPLHEAGRPFTFRADCADVPYVLRAYFSYRRGLPFVYTARVRGHGHDPRYLLDAVPVGHRRWTDFTTPRQLVQDVGSDVHSGFFRAASRRDDTDFYPAAITRQGIHPGTAYYDPNGHVLVVYDVRPNGEVLMFDGHPGGSFTARPFSERLAIGSQRLGGGFKNFRPITYQHGVVSRPTNADLPDYDPDSQYDTARHVVNGLPTSYHAWVCARLALGTTTPYIPAPYTRSHVRYPAHVPAPRAPALVSTDVAVR